VMRGWIYSDDCINGVLGVNSGLSEMRYKYADGNENKKHYTSSLDNGLEWQERGLKLNPPLGVCKG
jgi:hypothetical protein